MPEWSPEVTVDAAFARRLISGQFPDVALESLRLIGEGWDNTVWLVDERWVFRFPRRQLAIPGFEREIRALGALAPGLPLPVPAPVFVGAPADGFPWPFFGARYLPGSEPLGLPAGARARLARPLGEFLRALHASEVPDLPPDPFGRADMAIRVPGTRERFAALAAEGLWRAPPSALAVLDAAAALPAAAPNAVCHGDLHLRHLLVDEAGAAAGVIDWGDLCRGDPAIDMCLVWCLLPSRDEFLAAYGPVSDDQLLRARVLALFLCAVLALYGHHEGMPALRDEALAGLDRTSTAH
ncbi:MAG TPA: phosphotransferase [Solirubrobacteraceae bacterium]|nr:phosphotransferase [Solirubrobacteraceae bacterium]